MPAIPQPNTVQGGQLADGLAAGVDMISQSQEVKFTLYQRTVLPLDGYVFWINASLLQTPPNMPLTITVKGSLHYSAALNQDKDDSASGNQVIFTALSQVNDLDAIAPNLMYIAQYGEIKIGFSSRIGYYFQSGLHHYRGLSLLATMDTQIIDSLYNFDINEVVVSDSLPIWLSLNGYQATLPLFPAPPTLPVMYPSFAIPLNLSPPYISVHISPNETESLQPIANMDNTGSSWQLASDKVELTLYGMSNNSAKDFLDYLINYFNFDPAMGLMGTPIIRDMKENQLEFQILSKKKTITMEISYYQARTRQIAQQLIESVIITYIPPVYADFVLSAGNNEYLTASPTQYLSAS